jgi:hypothetical protein
MPGGRPDRLKSRSLRRIAVDVAPNTAPILIRREHLNDVRSMLLRLTYRRAARMSRCFCAWLVRYRHAVCFAPVLVVFRRRDGGFRLNLGFQLPQTRPECYRVEQGCTRTVQACGGRRWFPLELRSAQLTFFRSFSARGQPRLGPVDFPFGIGHNRRPSGDGGAAVS